MCGVWREYDVAGIGGGEFTLRLIPRQKVAPLYWRSDTHTHTQSMSQDKASGSLPGWQVKTKGAAHNLPTACQVHAN
jgi:hypothetical protein